MPKKTIEQETENLKTYEIEPLKDRVSSLEDIEKQRKFFSLQFSQKMKEEEFQNKVGSLFSKKLKEEEFSNKVESISAKKIQNYVQGKLGWAAAVWIVTILASFLAQKFLHIF